MHARSVFCIVLSLAAFAARADTAPAPAPETFVREVGMRLDVPEEERAAYARRLEAALTDAGFFDPSPQYFVLVDRSPQVQAVFVYWRSPEAAWRFIGASPASTGLPGEYEHFLTPLGVFEHALANMDFRAEGTRNSLGILGYGREGMRVYDFGWVSTGRGWGTPHLSTMRLQMHATDPEFLEPLLGRARSKGCIRIPASLDAFLDRYGLLDADYEAAFRAGRHIAVLRADREPTQWPGRWLVVVDSARNARPAWSPLPRRPG